MRQGRPSPPAPSVTAGAALPGTGPAIHMDLDALASRLAEKLQATQPVSVEAAKPAGPSGHRTGR